MTRTPRTRLTREQSQQRTRELLLDAAAEIFARRGFHGASVEEVAEAAGYSKGAVYSNFASKEELFLAVLDRHLAKELDAMEYAAGLRHPDAGNAPTASGGDGEGRAQQDAPTSFALQVERGRIWNVLAMEFWLYAMRDERARALLAERYRRARQMLAEQVRQRQGAGDDAPSLPAEYLAWTLIALGSGLALQAYLEPDSSGEALPNDLYRSAVRRLLAMPVRSSESTE